MCDPKFLCKHHLLGEHVEIHKHRHIFVKGYSIEGRRGQIEPASMKTRHDELVIEMLRRGINHSSPYEQPDLSNYDLSGHVVNRESAMADLFTRCWECKQAYEQLNGCTHE